MSSMETPEWERYVAAEWAGMPLGVWEARGDVRAWRRAKCHALNGTVGVDVLRTPAAAVRSWPGENRRVVAALPFALANARRRISCMQSLPTRGLRMTRAC